MSETSMADEGLRHLKALLAFDTSNPPGNESVAARYLHDVLKKEGLDPVIIEPETGRGSVVARIKGNGKEKPLLLISHLDVVPAEVEKWELPPFAAQSKDGYLYGRGAVDMKNMTAMSLMAILEAKRRKWDLNRDIIFAAVADEETGGRLGASYLVDKHPELIRAEFALSEMGGFQIDVRGQKYFLVQTAEKGCAWCRVRFHGEPGHSSVPDSENAISKMAKALVRLERKKLPHCVTEPVRRFFEELSVRQSKYVRMLMKALLNKAASRWAFLRLKSDQAKSFYSLLHATAVPTIVSAGNKQNVIPSCAEVVLDCRTLPGQNWEEVRNDLQRSLGKEAEIELIYWQDSLEFSPDTQLFDVIRQVVCKREPEAEVAPYMLPALTDARHLQRIGIVTYGFSPMLNDPEMNLSKLAHGQNERIGLDAFAWGVEVLVEVVRDFCSCLSAAKAADSLIEEMMVTKTEDPDVTKPQL